LIALACRKSLTGDIRVRVFARSDSLDNGRGYQETGKYPMEHDSVKKLEMWSVEEFQGELYLYWITMRRLAVWWLRRAF